ncbi:protein Wnt-7a-like [Oscarella lobularis]
MKQTCIVLILFCIAVQATWLDLGQRLIDEEIRLRGPDFDPDIVHIPEEDIKPTLDCYDVNMTTGQFQICEKSEKGLLVAIAQGINAAVYTCKRDFENRQWNCTDPFGNAFTAGSRQAAYVRSLVGVAVTYSITIACSYGSLPLTCGCLSRSKLPPFGNRTYEWGECSHDVSRAATLASNFIIAGEEGEDEETSADDRLNSLANVHNYEAGTKIATTAVKVVCRCLGGTLSCATKVCHRELRQFSHIGSTLVDKYNKAVQIKLSKNGERLKSADSTTGTFEDTDLVYANSASLCEPNSAFGYDGIHGRECISDDPSAPNYCPSFCCGYGYFSYIEEKKRSCRCKLKCCFELICDVCIVERTKYRCK